MTLSVIKIKIAKYPFTRYSLNDRIKFYVHISDHFDSYISKCPYVQNRSHQIKDFSIFTMSAFYAYISFSMLFCLYLLPASDFSMVEIYREINDICSSNI